ncbi:DoxX family protein [Sporichthya sp.]|uniref:DoxX family protein n=1 Tax=Sporichthya sp. TaxID=65475 RepID=UPI001792C9CE|nr:DoxX family protein [Sporichthya sp.]MBA3742397.1 DoxX family protein [Sporichthya sp.]
MIADLRSSTWPQRLLGVFFMTTGILHFINAQSFENITPDYLPAHLALVLISGVAEFAGGLGLLLPQVRRQAGIGLILLLIVIFPANIDMLVHADEQSIPEPLLWARLPLQPLLIWWVYRASLRQERSPTAPCSTT